MSSNNKSVDELQAELHLIKQELILTEKIPLKINADLGSAEAAMELEFALNKSHRRLVRTLEHMSDGFFCLDSNWIFTYVNANAADLFNKKVEELLDHNIWEVFPEKVGKNFYLKVLEAAESQKQINFENYYEPWDRWFEHRVIPTEDCLAIFFQEITERKRLEAALTQRTQQLETNNHQLNDFCNIVSHNLRAPLVNLSMLTEFLSEENTREELNELSSKIQPLIRHLNDLFNELVESLQVRQDANINSQKVNLAEVFNKTEILLKPEIAKYDAVITYDFDAVSTLFYPKKYIDSIALNLVSNALKYSSPDRKPLIKISSIRDKENVVLIIKDNGLGLDVELHKENLFKIRKVFHKHADSRGFGLFMTRTHVESMGGKIWVESNPGNGATFYVELVNQK